MFYTYLFQEIGRKVSTMPAQKEPDRLRLKLSPKKSATASKPNIKSEPHKNIKTILKRHIGEQQTGTDTKGSSKNSVTANTNKVVARVESSESDSGDSKVQDTVGEISFQKVMKKKAEEEVVSWIVI